MSPFGVGNRMVPGEPQGWRERLRALWVKLTSWFRK